MIGCSYFPAPDDGIEPADFCCYPGAKISRSRLMIYRVIVLKVCVCSISAVSAGSRSMLEAP